MICCFISLSSVCCILISIIFSGLPGLKLLPYDTFVLQMFSINPSQDGQTGWFLCQCDLHPAELLVRAQLCSTWGVDMHIQSTETQHQCAWKWRRLTDCCHFAQTYLLPTLELCNYILCYNGVRSIFTGWMCNSNLTSVSAQLPYIVVLLSIQSVSLQNTFKMSVLKQTLSNIKSCFIKSDILQLIENMFSGHF